MSFKDFLEKSRTQVEKRGTRALPEIFQDFAVSAVSKLPYLSRLGTNVYDKEWDILVVLDACRADVYRQMINADADSIWSVGSSSEEWMTHTFSSVDTSTTAYVTGNIFSGEYLDKNDFYLIEEVWRYSWDDNEGTIPPRPITNEAVKVWREENAERMIVHYMQPHFPAIGSDLDVGGKINKNKWGSLEWDLWLGMRYGEIDVEDAWNAYCDNLEYIFEEVMFLMENVSGQVAITADHGNAFGEWGHYGHPSGFQIPPLRRVPWDTYMCNDTNEFEPVDIRKEEATASEVENRLRDLGYV